MSKKTSVWINCKICGKRHDKYSSCSTISSTDSKDSTLDEVVEAIVDNCQYVGCCDTCTERSELRCEECKDEARKEARPILNTYKQAILEEVRGGR